MKLNMKLKQKLLLAFGAMAVVIAAVSLLSISLVRTIDEDMDYIIGVSGPMVEHADDILMNLWESLKVALEHAGSADPENMQTYRVEFTALYDHMVESAAELDALVPDQEVQASLDGALASLDEYRTHVYAMMDAHEAGERSRTTELRRTARQDVDAAIGHLDALAARADELGKEADARSDTAATAAVSTLWTALVLGFMLAIGIGYFIARMIDRPVQALSAAAKRVAGGDLDVSVEVTTKDEIGALTGDFNTMVGKIQEAAAEADRQGAAAREAAAAAEEAQAEAEAQQAYLARSVEVMLAEVNRFAEGDLTVYARAEREGDAIAELFDGFNRAAENLRAMITQVGAAVETTASASAEISATTEQLSSTAQEQSVQSQEVAAAIEQMVRTIVENSQNATQTSQAAGENGEAASEGGRVVEETVAKIRQIAQVVTDSARTVGQLGERSEQIGEIVETIEDIADQTNLLALNAAIEAARAGEHGRGFAVVADEVRKLAERTTRATQEIAGMIKAIQAETGTAVETMRRGNDEVEEGIVLADRAGESLRRIVEGADRTVDMVAQIAAASEEQSTTSEQIARSVEMISTASHESAAGITQIAQSTDGLNRQAAELRELVGQFRTNGSGAPRGAVSEARPDKRLSYGDGHAHSPVEALGVAVPHGA
jgi:methyl-accepting chemotaxis protein